MNFLYLVAAGVILALLSPPVGLMLIIVGLSLHFFQKYHTRRLDEEGRRERRT